MKMNQIYSTLLLLVFCFDTKADDANGVYFWQDATCMSKRTFQTSGVRFIPFTDYQLTIDAETDVIFRLYDTDKHYDKYSDLLPRNVLSCSDKANLGEAWAQHVNQGKSTCYLIERIDGQFALKEVDEVIFLHKRNDGFSYESTGFAFEFLYGKNYAVGEDLRSKKDKGGILFYTGKNEEGVYQFRSYDADYATYVDYSFSVAKGLVGANTKDERLFISSEQQVMASATPIPPANAASFSSKGSRREIPAEYDMKVMPKLAVNRKPAKAINLNPKQPFETSKAVYHVVAPGESLYQISKLHNTTMEKLKNLNGLEDSKIFAFQKLKVSEPSNDHDPLVEVADVGRHTPSASPGTSTRRTHEVVAGDNLYRIAIKYGVTVAKVMEWNSLKDEKLSPKQTLFVTE